MSGPGRGFSLIEIAVVLAIVGLLLGALLSPLAMQQHMQRVKETERALDHIEQALIGFALTRGRLPCADRDDDGMEDGDSVSGCDPGALDGTLPWGTLASVATDAWGSEFRYRVSEEFTHAVGTGMPPAADRLDLHDTRGTITVLSRGDDPGTDDVQERHATITLAAYAPVVVVSTGANGGAIGATPTGADEAENLDGDETFVLRGPTPDAAACDDDAPAGPPCEFDDLGRWISAPELLYRLVQAGLLP